MEKGTNKELEKERVALFTRERRTVGEAYVRACSYETYARGYTQSFLRPRYFGESESHAARDFLLRSSLLDR